MRKLFLILMAVLACSWSLSAQTKTIHGTVLDAANNEPLIGATIMPIGGGQGVAAQEDGNFTIVVPAKVTKATVSYVGYTSQTVTLKDGMTIYLASSATDLEDVVVVAYGTATKESLTGSVTVVGSKEIEDRPITSATAALEGNAPGVQVNNSIGSPGKNPDVRIRGFSSMTSSEANNPLYVVDGVPYNGGINDINPDDIESMSVLKDAASCALYGNKGSNGVILITTKRAKREGKPEVSLRISQGMFNRGLPQYERLGTDQWMEQTWKGVYNQLASTTDYTHDRIVEYLTSHIMSPSYIPNNLYGDADGNPLAGDQVFDANGKLTGHLLPGYTDLDWWDAISRSGYRQEYTVNATGASEKFNVFSSIGYLNEKGYLVGTDFERYTGRLNANYRPTSYLAFGVNLNASAQHSEVNETVGEDGEGNNANPFATDNYSPIMPYYNHNADGSIIYDNNGKPQWSTDAALGGLNMGYYLRLNKQDFTYYTIDGTAYGQVFLPYGFDIKILGNLSRSKQENTSYTNNVTGNGVSFNGLLLQQAHDIRYSTFQQTLNWAHDYGWHHVDAVLVHENWEETYSYFYGYKMNQSFDGIYTMGNFVDMQAIEGAAQEDRTEAYSARGRYNFMQKYFFEASIRRDGSSRFKKGNKWGTFWSLGASWIITKENFMNAVPWINYAKLRVAYGTVGNCIAANLYNYLNNYAMGSYFNQAFVVPSGLASNNLKWETTKSFDIGLEASLFDDRFNFSAGYYDKRSTDLIFAVVMPRSAGSTSMSWLNPTVRTNIGTMSNRGWELTFGVDILRTKDFTWRATLDASFLSNKIIKLPDHKDIQSGNQRRAEGHSIYEWYTFHYAGVDQMTGNALYELDPNAYEFRYQGEAGQEAYESRVADARAAGALVEINGKTYTTDNSYASRDWRGTALPTVYGSFGTSFTWKGISLGMLFTYSLGGKVYDSQYSSLMSVSDPKMLQAAYHKDVLKSWSGVPEGMTADSPNRIDPNGIPQFNFANSVTNNGGSDRWLTSSDYLTFKNLNVGYTLPRKWTEPLQLQRINIGFSVDNLFTVTARKGMNPQQTWAGEQYKDFVTARVFSFTLGATF